MSTQDINRRLQERISECRNEQLREAMAYSLMAGGKKLRPRLLLAVCEAVCGYYDGIALDFACAMEMLHTYSLIHDDLPAMDNDDLRRGKPTCHIVYGEAMAILAGDALLSHAMETMAGIVARRRSAAVANAMRVIAEAAGANGMIAGQVQDIIWEQKKAGEATLLNIQELKTMALIAACAEAGALLGRATKRNTAKYKYIGQCLGRAFQIKDDILDVTATSAEMGKATGKDERKQKNTYVSVLGMERAQADYNFFSEEARKAIASFPHKTGRLQQLAEEFIARKN
jgi:geranylgeranyl diphosphate synthase type II